MIRSKFFRRANFKLLKEGSSDEISSLSDLHFLDSTKQFKNSTSQKLDRKSKKLEIVKIRYVKVYVF